MNKFLTKGIAFSMAAAVAISGMMIIPKTTEKVSAADAGYEGYELVWSDEFNGTELDRNNWNVEVTGSGGGNNELQYYIDDPDNIEVSDGSLKITALKEKYNNKNYTSGRINTQGKKSFKYGRIEARMKLPCFQGIWPAFWMLGDSYSTVGWPSCGEIDIMEAINAENKVYGTVHWSYQGNHAEAGGNLSGVDRTDWHVYAIEWTSTQIKWYCDDVNFYTQNISDAAEMQEFKAKNFIIFNVAVGGNWPGFTIDDSYFPDSSTMEVDYVRVYQPKKEEYTGPTVTITEDVVATTASNWTPYFGTDWSGVAGTATVNGTASDGITMNVTDIGTNANGEENRWGIQATLAGLNCYPGNTYVYECTLLSDEDKVVFVKVADEGDGELSAEYITLKAGVPYEYSKEVYIEEDVEGTLKLAFGLGQCPGDTLADGEGYNLTISNVSLTTTATIPESDVKETTTVANNGSDKETTTVSNNGTNIGTNNGTTAQGTGTDKTTTVAPTTKAPETTTVDSTTKASDDTDDAQMKKPRKVTIKKVYAKKKAAKIVKVKIKKVKGATAYQVQIAKAKNFKKKNILVNKKNVKKLTVSAKSNKLKNKKKLFVRARAYVVKASGKKVYGKWSKIKKVRIK